MELIDLHSLVYRIGHLPRFSEAQIYNIVDSIETMANLANATPQELADELRSMVDELSRRAGSPRYKGGE